MTNKNTLTEKIYRIQELEFEKALLSKELRYLEFMLDRLRTEVDSEFRARYDASEYGERSQEVLAETKIRVQDQPPTVQARWDRIDRLEQEVGEMKMDVFYDRPRPLLVTVFVEGTAPREIDVLRSIKNDIRNLGNPIIIRAIQRHKALAFSAKTKRKKNTEILGADERLAQKRSSARRRRCLEAIAKAIVEPHDNREAFKPFDDMFSLQAVFRYDLETFEQIATVARSKTFKTTLTNSNKLALVHRSLANTMPNEETTTLMRWLKDRLDTDGLPKRISAESLKNDFVAWSAGVPFSSGRPYASTGLKNYKKLIQNLPTEQQNEEAVAEAVHLGLGFEILPYDGTISKLALADKMRPT